MSHLQPCDAEIQALSDGQQAMQTDAHAVVLGSQGLAQSSNRQQEAPQSLVNTESRQISEYQKHSQRQEAVLDQPQGELHMRQSQLNHIANTTGQKISAKHQQQNRLRITLDQEEVQAKAGYDHLQQRLARMARGNHAPTSPHEATSPGGSMGRGDIDLRRAPAAHQGDVDRQWLSPAQVHPEIQDR